MKLLLLNNSGSGAAPGGSGSNTQVIFNDNGVLAGDVDLTWNKTTNVMTVAGDVNLSDGGTYTTTLQTITPTAARTISLPDATGTVALVAGSSGQLVYNNAGAYAGVSTMTFSGNNVTLAGRLINSYTSVADSPAKVFTGTWFTGGTATTTKPHLLIEPTGTTSTAWSTSGTGIGVNAASTFTGRLLDLQTNGTSRAIVTGGGDVLVNRTSTTFLGGAVRFGIEETSGSKWCLGLNANGTAVVFNHTANTSSSVGTITVTTSATTYNTSSDYRLKENITAVADGITRLQQLKPSRFNFKADPDHTVDGFIAHEAQAVVPECVTGTKDAVDDDGNPVYQGIDQSKLVPLLTAALQEAIGEIESLKARVAALEGA